MYYFDVPLPPYPALFCFSLSLPSLFWWTLSEKRRRPKASRNGRTGGGRDDGTDPWGGGGGFRLAADEKIVWETGREFENKKRVQECERDKEKVRGWKGQLGGSDPKIRDKSFWKIKKYFAPCGLERTTFLMEKFVEHYYPPNQKG